MSPKQTSAPPACLIKALGPYVVAPRGGSVKALHDAVQAVWDALLVDAERAFMVGSEYDDYCCDCGTNIRTGDEPYGDWKAEIPGWFIRAQTTELLASYLKPEDILRDDDETGERVRIP